MVCNTVQMMLLFFFLLPCHVQSKLAFPDILLLGYLVIWVMVTSGGRCWSQEGCRESVHGAPF